MATDPKHGLGGALAPAIEGDRPPGDDLVQLDLLGSEPLLGPIMRDGSQVARSGPGRPPGSRNKRTQDWADFILARYRSPLIGLAELVSTPVADLARALGCEKIEAAEFWRKCAAELAGYLHQRQPVAIDMQGAAAGMLTVINVGAGGDPAAAGLAQFGLAMTLAKGESNQELGGRADTQSDDGKSDE